MCISEDELSVTSDVSEVTNSDSLDKKSRHSLQQNSNIQSGRCSEDSKTASIETIKKNDHVFGTLDNNTNYLPKLKTAISVEEKNKKMNEEKCNDAKLNITDTSSPVETSSTCCNYCPNVRNELCNCHDAHTIKNYEVYSQTSDTSSEKKTNKESAISKMKKQTYTNNLVPCPKDCLNFTGEVLSDLQTKCETKNNKIACLKIELNKLKISYMNEIERNKTEIINLQRTMDRLNYKLQWYHKENKKLSENFVKSKEECTNVYKTLAQKNFIIEDFDKNDKNLKKQLNLMNEEKIRIEDANHKLNQDLTLEITKNLKLKDDYQTVIRENNRLIRDNEYLKYELEAIEKHVNNNNKEVRKLRCEIQTKNNKINDLEQNNASLSQEKKSIDLQKQNLLENFDTAVENCNDARYQKLMFEEENEKKSREICRLQILMEEVKCTADTEKKALERELKIANDQTAALELELVCLRTSPRSPYDSATPRSSLSNQKKLRDLENKNNELNRKVKLISQETAYRKSLNIKRDPSLIVNEQHIDDDVSSVFVVENLNTVYKQQGNRDELLRVIALQRAQINKMKEAFKAVINATSVPLTGDG